MQNLYRLKINQDICAIYAPDTLGLVFCDINAINSTEDIFRIKSRELQQKVEKILWRNDSLKPYPTRPVRTLYLCTSYNCNLRCSYCLMQNSIAEDQAKNVMSYAVADKAVKYFTENSSEHTEREVVFYGGEPVLYPDLLYFIYQRINECDKHSLRELKPCRYIMCTNGMLLTDPLIEFIAKAHIYPAVSIDGNKEIHDAHRIKEDGTGSFDETKKGYQKLINAGISAGISMTLGSHLSYKLPQLVQSIAQEFSPKTLAINTMMDFQNLHNPFVPGAKELSSILWDAFLVARQEGVYIVKNVMDNRIRPFVERQPRLWGCTGMGGRIGVLPDGKLVPCMALPNYFKDIDTNPPFKDLFPERLVAASPIYRSECAECPARSTCGGGCPANSILKHSESPLDEPYCIASKLFLDNMIRLLWELCHQVALENIKLDGVYIPTDEDRLGIYGNIKVEGKISDYQYTPY